MPAIDLQVRVASNLGRPKNATKRANIVRAAAALFMEDGYELTSMEAVAKKAGVSKLTIYSHFDNKAELFRDIVASRCDKFILNEDFDALAKQPVEKALNHIGSALLTMIASEDSLRMQRIMHAEALHHPEVIRAFYDAGPRRVREAFNNLLREWNRTGQLSVAHTERATEQFFGLLKGETMSKVLLLLEPPPSKRIIASRVKDTVEFFLTVYRHPTAAKNKNN